MTTGPLSRPKRAISKHITVDSWLIRNPTCQGKCSHPVYFVQKIKGVYNCRVICKRESDLIRKSEKESTSVGLEAQKDAIHLATDVATLPIG